MGISTGALAGGASLVGGLSGMFGNNPSNQVSIPPPPGMGQAWGGAMQGIQDLPGYNMYGQNLGTAQGITQGMLGGPYAQQFQQGAGQAGAMGQQGAMNQFSMGGMLGMGGLQALQTSMDPQMALYNRTAQQYQDQVRAGEAARGIATTPYGAGLENQAMSNFNIDWQNQQLGRQLQGLQGAGGAFGTGAGLQSGAATNYLQAAGMPWATQQGIGQGQYGALNALGQFGQGAAGQQNQMIQDYLGYLNAGQNQEKLQLQQAQQVQQANQGFGQSIGQGLQGLGKAFGGQPQTGGWQSSNPMGPTGIPAF